MSEPSPKRACFANEGTPRYHRTSTGRRLAVTHGNVEVYSSPILVGCPLAFEELSCLKSSSEQCNCFQNCSEARKPTHLHPFLHNTYSEQIVSDSEFTQPIAATSPEQLVCKG